MAQTEKAPWEQLGEEFIKQYYMLFDTLQKTALLGLYHVRACDNLTHLLSRCIK